MSGQGHPFVSIRVRPDGVELAELRLWELGATGLEQRDQTTIVRDPSAEDVLVIASFNDEETARTAHQSLARDYPAQLGFVPPQNWATEWRRGFGAQRIGTRLLLHPSWETVQSGPEDVVVTIDPENAFGSGDHETTRLVLGLLDALVRPGDRVLDVGCGSGILSIAAVRLGAGSSVAIDVEDAAIEATARNAELNGVAAAIQVSQTPLSEVSGDYEIVVANIEARVLINMPEALAARMAPGAPLILSGILLPERDTLLGAYDAFRVDQVVEEGEWCALVLRRANR